MRFGVLGPFEVVDDQGRELTLGGFKQRAVLAILLVQANEVVSTARLIDELWAERSPASAAKTVQVYVSNLRKALGDGVLVTRGRGYVLRAAQGEVDADRFRRLVSEARDKLSAGDPGSAGAVLREALGLGVERRLRSSRLSRLRRARSPGLRRRGLRHSRIASRLISRSVSTRCLWVSCRRWCTSIRYASGCAGS